MVALPRSPDRPRRRTGYSPEDVLKVEDGNEFELHDGRLERLNFGNEANWIATRFFLWLTQFVDAQQLGLVMGLESGYILFADRPELLRKPDASFVAAGRLPGDRPSRGYEAPGFVPDLVVEVISPHDNAYRVERKLREYVEAGVELTWVAYPETRTIRIVRPGGSEQTLTDAETLTGEGVLPGFERPVRDFFPAE